MLMSTDVSQVGVALFTYFEHFSSSYLFKCVYTIFVEISSLFIHKRHPYFYPIFKLSSFQNEAKLYLTSGLFYILFVLFINCIRYVQNYDIRLVI